VLGDRFAEVLERAQGGDVEAFAELYRQTQPMLVRYLRVTTGQQAEDIASQTWVRVIESLGSFEGPEPGFRRWVVAIGRNIWIDELRRSGRRPEELVAETPERPDDTDRVDPALVAQARLSTEAALALVATLPPDQAEMVGLRVLVGLDVAEVAELVGKSPGAVRVAVHRGLRRLRERLVGADAALGVTGSAGGALVHQDA